MLKRKFLIGILALLTLSITTRPHAIIAQSTPPATLQPPPTNTPRATTLPPPPTNTLAVPLASNTAPATLPLPATATVTLTPSKSPTPTKTPTPSPTPRPTLIIEGTYATPDKPLVTAIPARAATPLYPAGNDIVSILLLGSDTITAGAVSRTDVMVVVVINRTTQTVTMLHLPRDLYAYVPNHTMAKLNTVMNLGNVSNASGGGIKLLKDTLLYNFGIKVDFYARVDFVGFQKLVNALGGLEINVDCAVQGNRLKSPDLDYQDPNSYEVYTLPIGHHVLNGYMALWYVRARGSSSDLDRGRRQLEVLKTMWRQAKDKGIFQQVVTLWPQAQEFVETDLTLNDLIGFAPLALAIEPNNIQRISLRQNVHFTAWYTADQGSFVWIPDATAWKTVVQNLVLPPSKNRLGGENPSVEVGAALAVKGYEVVAADRLSWDGFNVRILPTEGMVKRTVTVIYDYTGGSYPTSLKALASALRVPQANIVQQPDPNRTVDFRVEMGPDYGTSCMYALPTVTPEATQNQ